MFKHAQKMVSQGKRKEKKKKDFLSVSKKKLHFLSSFPKKCHALLQDPCVHSGESLYSWPAVLLTAHVPMTLYLER